MANFSVFDSPMLLGFDHLEQMIDQLSKGSGGSGYPPYNIEQLADNHLRITLAVAGFSEDDLDITLDNRKLTIRGEQAPESGQERVFLHRGIAGRRFERAFMLSDEIEVSGAEITNGLLHIDLERIIEERPVKRIKIRKKGDKPSSQLEIDADE